MIFNIEHSDAGSQARAGAIVTSRGIAKTPLFMPVATRGTVRALSFRELDEIGFEMILSNTYHLYIRPGMEVMGEAGGLNNFMNFHRPLLTDSGGFQVFSLSDLCRVFPEGVEFRSHLDGSRHFFTPEKVLDIQKVIGSDIMMVLDQCASYPVTEEEAAGAVEKTVDWAEKSMGHWKGCFDREKQALFGIVQGGVFRNLRRECAGRLMDLDFPGYAIGGLSVGEPGEAYRDITSFLSEILPVEKPRYMMGVGSPLEILHAVTYGVDMFDCVMPTRIARNGTLFTSRGRINIKGSIYEKDFNPLDDQCLCYVCRNFSRAYLRHLFRVGEISALSYFTYHNLYFMKSFFNEIREGIISGNFSDICKKWESVYLSGNGKN